MLRKIMVLMVLIPMMILTVGCAKNGDTKDGQYDYNFDQVSDAEYLTLPTRVRMVSMEVFDKDNKGNEPDLSISMFGYISSDEEVYVPIQLFYIPTPGGIMSVLNIPDISIKLFILPDKDLDGDWKKEELGAIKKKVYEEHDVPSGYAIIERINPIIARGIPKYTLGDYNDLSRGRKDKALYWIRQNGKIHHSTVTDLYIDGDGRNIISFQAGEIYLPELGGLLFAIRDGKIELVGMLNTLELKEDEPGRVWVYAQDIGQIK